MSLKRYLKIKLFLSRVELVLLAMLLRNILNFPLKEIRILSRDENKIR